MLVYSCFFFASYKSSQIMDSILCKLKRTQKTLIQCFASSKNINLIFCQAKKVQKERIQFFASSKNQKKHGFNFLQSKKALETWL